MKFRFDFVHLWIFSYLILVLQAIDIANENETVQLVEMQERSNVLLHGELMFPIIEGSATELSTELSFTTADLIITIFDTSPSPESTTSYAMNLTKKPLNESLNGFRNSSRLSAERADDLIELLEGLDQIDTVGDAWLADLPAEIDNFIELLNITISRSNNQSSVIFAKPIRQNGIQLIGVYLRPGRGEFEVNNTTKDSVLDSNFTAGVIVESKSLQGIDFMSVAIFAKPTAYQKLAQSTNVTLVSPVLVMTTKKDNQPRLSQIDLYFELLPDETRHETERYTCSFYNTSNCRWESTGCSPVRYDSKHNRFECRCDHQTTFALLLLPNVPDSRHFNAQDIASVSSLSISIVAFVLVIAHSLTSRLSNPWVSIEARDLLPMISSGTTTLLFVLFITLSVTVYLQRLNEQCSISARMLMYFVYVSLILMFCVKTSVGYFNYLRFVRLFPEPSFRRLAKFLVTSMFIALICLSFLIGFDQNYSVTITRVHSGKLCWFKRDVLHYFLTIPLGLFLLANTFMIICVAKHIFRYTRSVSPSHQLYERRKRCVIVLLSSCLTQGIGWFSGLFLSLMFPSMAVVMSWIFTLLNGLEGLWTIVLYCIIRSQKMDRSKRAAATKALFSKPINEIIAVK